MFPFRVSLILTFLSPLLSSPPVSPRSPALSSLPLPCPPRRCVRVTTPPRKYASVPPTPTLLGSLLSKHPSFCAVPPYPPSADLSYYPLLPPESTPPFPVRVIEPLAHSWVALGGRREQGTGGSERAGTMGRANTR
eukprot:747574-Hanusia_phi.AAC.9